MIIRRTAVAMALILVSAAACSSQDQPRPAATGPVQVRASNPVSMVVSSTCRMLIQALPEVINLDLKRRPVTADPQRTAAWGDPAVTLVCGTGPSGLPGIDGSPVEIGLPGARCVSDPDPRQCVKLLQRDTGDGNAFTTYGRTVNVRVRVPDAYALTALQAMVAALGTTLPPEPSPAPTVSAAPTDG